MVNLKNIVPLLVILASLFSACKPFDPPPTEEYREILLLQVDYQTRQFEGGMRYAFPDGGPLQDSIPVLMQYQAPSDIGYLRLVYTPSSTTIFEGSILYDSIGIRTIPADMQPPSGFESAENTTPIENSEVTVYWNGPGIGAVPIQELWAAISDLSLVYSIRAKNAKVGLFLYVPTAVGGGEESYDWYFMLYR